MEHSVAIDDLEQTGAVPDADRQDDVLSVPEGAALIEQLPPPTKAKLQRAEATFRRERWEAELSGESTTTT